MNCVNTVLIGPTSLNIYGKFGTHNLSFNGEKRKKYYLVPCLIPWALLKV